MINTISYYMSFVLAALLGGWFSYLGIVKKYSIKKKYALRSRWALVMILLHTFTALVVCSYLHSTGAQIIPGVSQGFNYLLVSISSAGLSLVIISRVPVKTRTSSTQSLIEISAWIYELIQNEVECNILKEVLEIALRIEKKGVTIDKVKKVCDILICEKFSSGNQRIKQLAYIAEMAAKNESNKMILYLMGYVEAEWLEKQLETM